MSGRVSKSVSHRKSAERFSLAAYVADFGIDVMPCSRCYKRKIPCRMSDGRSSRCVACIQAKVSCSGTSVANPREFACVFLLFLV